MKHTRHAHVVRYYEVHGSRIIANAPYPWRRLMTRGHSMAVTSDGPWLAGRAGIPAVIASARAYAGRRGFSLTVVVSDDGGAVTLTRGEMRRPRRA